MTPAASVRLELARCVAIALFGVSGLLVDGVLTGGFAGAISGSTDHAAAALAYLVVAVGSVGVGMLLRRRRGSTWAPLVLAAVVAVLALSEGAGEWAVARSLAGTNSLWADSSLTGSWLVLLVPTSWPLLAVATSALLRGRSCPGRPAPPDPSAAPGPRPSR